MPGTIGNQNAKKARIWEQAIKRALARRANGTIDKGLDELADKIVAEAALGEQWALIEIGNRMDGKPAQMTVLVGDEDGGAVRVQKVERHIVDPQHPDGPGI